MFVEESDPERDPERDLERDLDHTVRIIKGLIE